MRIGGIIDIILITKRQKWKKSLYLQSVFVYCAGNLEGEVCSGRAGECKSGLVCELNRCKRQGNIISITNICCQ